MPAMVVGVTTPQVSISTFTTMDGDMDGVHLGYGIEVDGEAMDTVGEILGDGTVGIDMAGIIGVGLVTTVTVGTIGAGEATVGVVPGAHHTVIIADSTTMVTEIAIMP